MVFRDSLTPFPQPEKPKVEFAGNIKGNKKGYPGYSPMPVKVSDHIGVLLNQNLNDGYAGAEINVIERLPNDPPVFGVVQVKDHADCRVDIEFKVKAGLIGIGEYSYRVFNKSELHYHQPNQPCDKLFEQENYNSFTNSSLWDKD